MKKMHFLPAMLIFISISAFAQTKSNNNNASNRKVSLDDLAPRSRPSNYNYYRDNPKAPPPPPPKQNSSSVKPYVKEGSGYYGGKPKGTVGVKANIGK